MAARKLCCAIEDVVEWHPRLFLEPHVFAAVAVMSRYSPPPASFEVRCEHIRSNWLGRTKEFILEVAWKDQTARKADRLRATVQSRVLVEMSAVALGLILAHRVASLGPMDVTGLGDRADYRSLTGQKVLEISGTESLTELGRRHREKIAQALANPFGWDALVVVCTFTSKGHRIRFSEHRIQETLNDE